MLPLGSSITTIPSLRLCRKAFGWDHWAQKGPRRFGAGQGVCWGAAVLPANDPSVTAHAVPAPFTQGSQGGYALGWTVTQNSTVANLTCRLQGRRFHLGNRYFFISRKNSFSKIISLSSNSYVTGPSAQMYMLAKPGGAITGHSQI